MDNPALEALDLTVQCIFTADVAVKIASEGVRPTRFWGAPGEMRQFSVSLKACKWHHIRPPRDGVGDQAGAAAGLEQF